ncbi:hypothetical protein ACFV3R_21670 [Streptomyces sp. NPDC059740]|uniref:hypothetical protein n=1 Tax=Streptomyces sp. NPDC059740 TaxID=3346926 RepID=UPI00365D614D
MSDDASHDTNEASSGSASSRRSHSGLTLSDLRRAWRWETLAILLVLIVLVALAS